MTDSSVSNQQTHTASGLPLVQVDDEVLLEEPINWNRIEDPKDLEVWNRLINNFWIPEKIPLSNDIPSWNTLTDEEKLTTVRVFAGLTLLDTIQAKVGAISLIPDAITPHEAAVYSDISLMEALAAGTQLLTSDGWKNIEEISYSDKIAQYDPSNNEISFAKPIAISNHFSDEVYEITSNNGNARQVVSGGHRVYVEEKKIKRNSCKEWTYKVYEARDLFNKKVNLRTANRRFRSAGLANHGRGMTAEDRLKVAIQADGSFCGSSPRYTGEICGYIPCTFDLTKQRKKDRLFSLAEEAGWKIETKSSGKIVLKIPMDHVGDRKKHFDEWWSIDSITCEWAKDFIEESGLWDGHTQKEGTGITYYTVNKRNNDFYTAVATLAGYRARTTVRIDDRKESYQDCYVTNVTLKKDCVGAQSIKVNKAEPQQVYCIQVPTTFLVTRNGNSPVITGNCIHAKSYSSIFSTLISTSEIDEAFRWSKENEHLQRKARIILSYYHGNDPEKKKIASTLLESFLFYSGFFMPFWWASKAKLTNTADIIRLILRDEALTGDHELLTPFGWVNISEVDENTTIAQYNKDDGTIEFVKPVKVSHHHEDRTWLFESEQGHVRQHVSPHHRMFLQRRGYEKDSIYMPEVIEAEDLKQSRLNGYSRFVNAGLKKTGNRNALTTEERLLIAISADGSYDTTTINHNGELRRTGEISGTVPVRFSFSKQRKIDRLCSLAEYAGWEIRFYKSTPKTGEVKEKKNISLYVPVEYVDRDKKLSTLGPLDDVTYEWCRDFIDEISRWDGYNNTGSRITWGSVREDEARFVQAVAALAGYRTHWKTIVDNRKETFSDYYRLQIHKKMNWSGGQAVNKIENGPAEVYCVQVPSTFLVTRNQGSVTITGNCVHGYYIGYKFQIAYNNSTPERQKELYDFTVNMVHDLMENEIKYTESLYDGLGLTEYVKPYLKYNANKALNNLGFEGIYSPEESQVVSSIMSALNPGADENHDFFSGNGSSYIMGEVESTTDDDWDF